MALFGLFGGKKDKPIKPDTQLRKFVRYTHMPEILPRIRAIGTKFGQFAYMLALVFRSARLLPYGHPMLNPANVGRYGIRDVIATAANGLVMKRENMDQVLIFGAVVMALIMIAAQAVLIGLYAFLGNAHAADGSMFKTEHPETDTIMLFLSQVFGFSNSVFDNATTTGAIASQKGLYAILGFYSTAMMIIAVIIVIYYVVTVVGESAQTGQPFGKRFNGLWAPIRLVLALGLLVPLGGGINAAQYLTLYIAKFGSGLATQGWIRFADNFSDPKSTLPSMSAPSSQQLAAAVFSAEACKAAYNQGHAGTNKPVRLRIDNGVHSQVISSPSEADITFAGNQPILRYVWTAMADNDNGLAPSTCGMIEMKVTSSTASVTGNAQLASNISKALQSSYIQSIAALVNAFDSGGIAKKFVNETMTINRTDPTASATAASVNDEVIQGVSQAFDQAQNTFNTAFNSSTQQMTGESGDAVLDQMKKDARARGWATAGVYYLEIAKFTQMVMEAVTQSVPRPVKGAEGIITDPELVNTITTVTTADGMGIPVDDTDVQIATVMKGVPDVIRQASGKSASVPATTNTSPLVEGNKEKFETFALSNPLLWLARWLFGSAFLQMVDEPTLNPMGKLIQGGSDILGKTHTLLMWYIVAQGGSLLAGAVGAIGGLGIGAAAGGGTPLSLVGGAIGAVTGAVGMTVLSKLLAALGGILWFFMLLGLAAGIVLFYLLPLLPFMYFFFSVVNWVIEVAEAFISMPLFALSHLRIDGEGFLPQTAYQNWLTLFGVMLRPLMIVVGMIVGSLVFNAGAYYLNTIYKYAIYSYNNNADTGVKLTPAGLDFSQISAFGIVTYTILYVYLVYMLANASFKLIDQIPDKMMRWVGGNNPFTGDRPVELNNMHNAALLGYGVLSQGSSAMSSVSGNLGKAGEAFSKRGGRGGTPSGGA